MNVLVADDDPHYRFLVAAALRDVASVTGAVDAAEAVQLAGTTSPDLALLDASLPGVFRAIPDVRLAAPAVRIVLTSIGPASELAGAAAAVGTVGSLGKDVAPSTLPRGLADLDGVVSGIEHALARVTRRLQPDRTSPAEARHLVGRAVAGWCDEELVESVVLCISELVTNAVVHARSGPVVGVEVRPSVVRVEVRDASAAVPTVGPGGDDATSGRGLMIVEAVADRWGVQSHSAGGKTVWFEVSRREPGS